MWMTEDLNFWVTTECIIWKNKNGFAESKRLHDQVVRSHVVFRPIVSVCDDAGWRDLKAHHGRPFQWGLRVGADLACGAGGNR